MKHNPKTERWKGVGEALLSAVLFGASAPLAKLLLPQVSPMLMAGLLYLGSGAGQTANIPVESDPNTQAESEEEADVQEIPIGVPIDPEEFKRRKAEAVQPSVTEKTTTKDEA